jgi:hypothetical protein
MKFAAKRRKFYSRGSSAAPAGMPTWSEPLRGNQKTSLAGKHGHFAQGCSRILKYLISKKCGGEEFARENNSRPLLIVIFLLKINSDGFSAGTSRTLKTVEDAGLL